MRLHALNVRADLLILAVMMGPALWSQDGGTITGRVIDENSKPIPAAKITLLRLESSRLLHRDDQADGNGEFVANRVRWGIYIVCAGKEKDGYTSTLALLYTTFDSPTVNLTRDSPQ